jgi:hypothetical protein
LLGRAAAAARDKAAAIQEQTFVETKYAEFHQSSGVRTAMDALFWALQVQEQKWVDVIRRAPRTPEYEALWIGGLDHRIRWGASDELMRQSNDDKLRAAALAPFLPVTWRAEELFPGELTSSTRQRCGSSTSRTWKRSIAARPWLGVESDPPVPRSP